MAAQIPRQGKLYTGTSGYSYQHWKGIFYPEGLAQAKWLPYYAERYATLEINATFYRTFGKHVFERWSSLTPEDFAFVIKGPKSITRDRRLKDPAEELAVFFDGAEGLGDKLGCVIWQMPPSFKLEQETLERLDNFLGLLPITCRHAFEFRHKSWDDQQALDVLKQHNAAWVSADSSRYYNAVRQTADFSYFRFHGPEGLYSSGYSDEQLGQWAKIVQESLEIGDAYCFFNNDFGGFAVKDAVRLSEIAALSSKEDRLHSV
jgi:uncharacterized protein YecE (DUF72 family)